MTTRPVITALTPLEERAILRFEFDQVFHQRCQAKAHQLTTTQPDDPIAKRLQDAMRELQTADEQIHDEEAIVRAANFLGLDLMGIPYVMASVPEKEGLKAAVRRILALVENPL
ncbi:hypothetical protein GCM10023063_15600 [Arthrobacter methylotrophus]|uniref:BetI-type transcriptional repressor C-terminal domain-containing protein n=1 Tax=Arthrobacter methylotrophus TaxID=121291 RepID=A0ABV5UNY1_9MICC